jgi:hypothetical protein
MQADLPPYSLIGQHAQEAWPLAVDEVRRDFLPLPCAAMREAGSATQTLGALYRLASEQQCFSTFARLAIIKEMACLPGRNTRSVERHLERLRRLDWICLIGRQRRRTNTWLFDEKAVRQQKPYGILPRWAALAIADNGLPWSCAAVFSIVAARHSLREALDGMDITEGAEHFQISLGTLESRTGLARATIITAKESLQRTGLITVERFPDDPRSADYLTINATLRLSPHCFPPSVLSRRKAKPAR